MKKYAPSILILIILVGLFSPMAQVNAEVPTPPPADEQAAKDKIANDAAAKAAADKAAAADPTKSTLEQNFKSCNNIISWTFDGCIERIFYFLLFSIPAWLLLLSAKLFNALIAISLSSTLFASSTFIPTAWAIVRDFANIFFILILLYIAIKIILGLGGSEVKKMIAQVIIMALLINFSMFFTKVVIDSSNILALIFYNQLTVNPTQPVDGQIAYTPVTKANEKDISGKMVSAFDPTKLLSQTFFDNLKNQSAQRPREFMKDGFWDPEREVPVPIILGLILVTGLIMCFAAYAFFIAGISFMGRLIELWLLIIFSPFAFMSSTVPKFAGVEYLGWDAWLKRLISTSFMAPIFMFFMFLIFMLVNAKLFGDSIGANPSGKAQDPIQTILLMVIGALIILTLLMKATEFAKKGGGQFAEMALKGVKMAGGLALGAATGGAAMLATSTIGAAAMKTANNDDLKKAASGDKEHFARLGQTDSRYNDVNFQQKMQRNAQKKLASANKTASRSFDLRDTGLGKFVGKQSGMDFNAGTGALGLSTKDLEGGRKKQEEHKVEKEGAKAKTYELSAAAAEKQNALASDPNNSQNIRAEQYLEDKRIAMLAAKEGNFEFNEKDFKEDYIKGGDMASHGITKVVNGGSIEKVQTAQQVNDDRRRAYGSSLDNEAKEGDSKNTVVKKAVNRFFDNYKVGVGKMVATPVGAGVTLTAGALSGGIGLALAPVLGGFVHALREQFKEGGGRSTNAELVAGVRKGEDKDKKLLKIIKEAKEDTSHDAHTPAAHPPTPTPSPTPHTPPAGNATEHH